MKLVILIPAFNEAESIAQVIRSMPEQIEGITQIQVLVVDDGSKDDTAVLAREAGQW